MRLVAGSPAELAQAAAVLRGGGLVAFPTDTVYGVGAILWNGAAVAKLYHAKIRPGDKAIPVLLADYAQLATVSSDLDARIGLVAGRFWPGPLTIVVKAAAGIPHEVTAGGDTIAVRVPDLALTRELIRLAGAPLATTSANLSGQPSPVSAADVARQIGDRIPLIVDGGAALGGAAPGGAASSGVASTIVDLTGPRPILLRPGPISLADIEAIWDQGAGRTPVL